MKNLITLFVILFVVSSCKKEDFEIINLNNNKIILLGHGGMGIGSTYPMNSFESIIKCLSLGADGTEIDVQMTKDSVLVAFHDNDLSNNTNMKGLINSLNWSEIKGTYYQSTPYLNYSIISLEQLFSNINNLHNYKFTFDCKLYPVNNNANSYYNTYINALNKIIDKYDLQDNIYIESQSEEFLKLLQATNNNYKLFIYPSSFINGLEIAGNLNLYGITISTRDITKEQIKIAHNNNFLVAIWNTHSKNKNIEGIRKNPDFIQTDRVEHLIKLLK